MSVEFKVNEITVAGNYIMAVECRSVEVELKMALVGHITLHKILE